MNRTLSIAGALLCALLSENAFAQAVQVPPAEQCFQAVTGINGMVGVLGTITGGSGGTSGTYTNISMTGGSGSGATANITVSGGAVTAVVIVNPGVNYAVGDTLSALSANIGSVSGFSVPIASISINSSLAGGTVGMYVPGTLTTKQTWQNASQTILNSNPITLDANGCALIYGTGTYRQILYDNLGNEVWDQPTTVTPVNPYWSGTAGGTANAITLSDASFASQSGQSINFIAAYSNTGSATLTETSSSTTYPILKNSSTGPVALVGQEIKAGNLVNVVYDATLGSYILTNPATLSSTVPLLQDVQSGSSAYTIPAADNGYAVIRTASVAVNDVLPQASGLFAQGFWFYYQNQGTAVAVLTPTTSTIAGLTQLVVPPGTGVLINSDGTNWRIYGAVPNQQGQWLLNTVTASNSATIQDTTSFGYGFNDYEFEFVNLIPAINNNNLVCLVQTGGSTWQTSNYAYNYNYQNSSTMSVNNGNPQSQIVLTPALVSNSTGGGIFEKLFVSSPGSSSLYKLFIGNYTMYSSSSPTQFGQSSGEWTGATSALTGLQCSFSSGNISSGTMKVYGRN